MLYGRATTARLDMDTPGLRPKTRGGGIWSDPTSLPARPAAVLILTGIWFGSYEATAELWLPPNTPSPLLPGPWTVITLGPDGNPVIAEAAQIAVSDVLETNRSD